MNGYQPRKSSSAHYPPGRRDGETVDEYRKRVGLPVWASQDTSQGGVKTAATADGRVYFAGISVAPDNRPKNPNPKDSIGSSKIPMHLWPHTATVMGALGLQDGALKYGRGNYRASPVRASIYYDAAIRHLFGWFSGRPCDPDSGLPDLAHALACLAIVVDADAAGTLIDDRDYNSGYPKFIAEMTQHVKRLQEMHADKEPRHFTIKDAA